MLIRRGRPAIAAIRRVVGWSLILLSVLSVVQSWREFRLWRDSRSRYHSWVDVWTFRDVDTGRRTLWLTRQLQPPGTWQPRFEVAVLDTLFAGGCLAFRSR